MEAAALQYPDIFTAEIVGLGDTLVFVNHPQAIQEILTNDRKKFVAVGEENKILQPVIGDYSVIMLTGNRHKRRRQILMPPFHGERLQAYGDLICNLTKKVFKMKLVLATILLRYQLELVDHRAEKPRRRSITLAPAGGVKMLIKGKPGVNNY